MHRPLSLFPHSRHSRDANSSTSSVTKGADSLAFSISDKNQSRCSVLIDDGNTKVSKELQSLQMKLSDLQNQIMPITMETFKNQTIKYASKFDKNSTTQFFKRKQAHSHGKENSMQKANAGKIVSREKGKHRLGKTINKRENYINSQTNLTKNSLATECSELMQKSKQVSKLKKEMQAMRHSLQKTQRSMSQCSQRLSASKSMIKSLKQEEKRQQRQNERLRQSLKKSESIRAKQKQVIITQRRQLQRYRQMLKHMQRG